MASGLADRPEFNLVRPLAVKQARWDYQGFGIEGNGRHASHNLKSEVGIPGSQVDR